MRRDDPTAPSIPLPLAMTAALAALQLDGVIDIAWLTISAPLWLPWLVGIAWAIACVTVSEIRSQAFARGRPS